MTKSKIPHAETSIFSRISALSQNYNAINLGQGFPNFDCPEGLKILVNKYLQAGKNQYAPMPGIPELRKAIQEKINFLYKHQVDDDKEITICAGATQAIYASITAFIHPGDEVIIFEPAYDSYKPSIEINGGIAVPCALNPKDYSVDWNLFTSLVNSRTCMVILNTPHNPTGATWKKSDFEQLEKVIASKDILILSDEVYEHLIYDGEAHHSILSFPSIWDKTIAVFSFGKTFHNTGWKIGYAVAPTTLSIEIRKIHQWQVFSVNSFVQYAIAEYLENKNHYLELSGFYQQKRDLFQSLMTDSPLKPIKCGGTYFQLYDYSAVSDLDDLAFAESLIIDHGVAAIPISVFYSDRQQNKVLRFCFAKTDDVLEQAGKALSNL